MTRRRRSPRVSDVAEIPFMKHLMLALGALPGLRVWRQNCGQIPVRDRTGKVVRVFDPGPPNGAADLSGIVLGSGRRLEIEVKDADGEQSDDQRRWQDFITRAGGVYVLVQYDPTTTLEENVAAAVEAVLFAASLPPAC
jgi:hypothetical protein